MKPRSWIRWAALHGVPRAVLGVRAYRGDPFPLMLADLRRGTDPTPLVERIRAEGPLLRLPYASVTANHQICRSVLRDTRFNVTTQETVNLPAPIKRLIAMTDPKVANPVEPPSMVVVDPPEHTELRRSVAHTFTPRALEKLRDRIVEVTDELLDGLRSRRDADLIGDFAGQLPVAVIAEILGMPASMNPTILGWGNTAAALLDNGVSWSTFRAADASLREADIFLRAHVERLRADPGEDILSELVVHGGLTEREVLSTAILLMGAGFETTVNLIGNGIALLLEHEDQLALLRDDPTLWPNAISEILRFDSPVQMTARTANCDVEVAGHPLRAGQTIVLLIGAANHDPAVFADPERFDVSRPNAKDHLSFGSGIHACLGASLARMEGEYALRALFERFPDLRLSGKPTPNGLVTLHGFGRLPVALGSHVQPAAQ